MKRRLLASTLVAAMACMAAPACGGAEVREEPPRMCEIIRPGAGTAQRPMRPNEWIALLTPGTREGGVAERDCAGRPIRSSTLPSCDPSAAVQGAPATAAPIGAESIVENRVDAEKRLVWLITHRFDDGTGYGPVALVKVGPQRAAVEAIGHLRAQTDRTRLRLTKVNGRELLEAEGQSCPNADDPSTCERTVQLMPRAGMRFASAVMYLENGECLGPGAVTLTTHDQTELPTGWLRKFVLNASLERSDTALLVHEQVVATELDPREPAVPSRIIREANTDRSIRFLRGRLVVSSPSLWQTMLRSRGSVAVGNTNENEGSAP